MTSNPGGEGRVHEMFQIWKGTYYSVDTWTMNAMPLFLLYFYFIFTYFVVIFYFFPELTNHILFFVF